MRNDQRRAVETGQKMLVEQHVEAALREEAAGLLSRYHSADERLIACRWQGRADEAAESLRAQMDARRDLVELIGTRAAQGLLREVGGGGESVVVFVDETELPARDVFRDGLGSLTAYGAVALPVRMLPMYARKARGVRRRHSIGPTEEFKWSPKKQQPRQRRLGPWGREPMQRELLKAAAGCGAWTVCVVWAKDLAPQREERMLTFLYERIAKGLEERGSLGTVIFDQKHDKLGHDAAWLADTRFLTDHGTEYVEARNVVMPFTMGPSEHLPGLQLADLVVGATAAAVAGRTAGLALREDLRLLMRRGPDGLGGFGLKLWPDRLQNLYTWLDNPKMLKGRTVSRGALPGLIADLPFARDDGLSAAAVEETPEAHPGAPTAPAGSSAGDEGPGAQGPRVGVRADGAVAP